MEQKPTWNLTDEQALAYIYRLENLYIGLQRSAFILGLENENLRAEIAELRESKLAKLDKDSEEKV
jgi:hypothetical protein